MNELQRLKINVHVATIALAPKFSISTEELRSFDKPGLEIGDRTHYVVGEKRLVFKSDDINSKEIIGEEVSHYLHMQINPGVANISDPIRRYESGAVIECVGHYGGIVYINEIGTPYSPYEWPSVPRTRDPIDCMAHEYGYKMAKRLFNLHGESFLPELARMSVNDAIGFFVRIDPGFYETKHFRYPAE